MNQTQFGEAAGLSKSYISLLFSGERVNLRDEAIASIARAYGARFEWLKTGEGNPWVDEKTGVNFSKLAGPALGLREQSYPYGMREAIDADRIAPQNLVEIIRDSAMRLDLERADAPAVLINLETAARSLRKRISSLANDPGRAVEGIVEDVAKVKTSTSP